MEKERTKFKHKAQPRLGSSCGFAHFLTARINEMQQSADQKNTIFIVYILHTTGK